MNTKNSTVTLIDNETGKKLDLPIVESSIGPNVIDIRNLYKGIGKFTFDPSMEQLDLVLHL